MSEWLWTIDPQDWMLRPRPTSIRLTEHIRRELTVRRPPLLQNTAVVLLHDGGGDRGATVGALKRIIDDIRTGQTSRLVRCAQKSPASRCDLILSITAREVRDVFPRTSQNHPLRRRGGPGHGLRGANNRSGRPTR